MSKRNRRASWQQTKALSALQKASESVKRKQKVVFAFAASSGAALYVMAPGNKLHDSSSQRRTRIIHLQQGAIRLS